MYRIEVTNPGGTKSFDYYSIQTGLKVRTISEGMTAVYKEYKSVDGIQFPYMMTQEAGGQSMSMEATSIQVNTGLSSDIFKL